MNYALKYDPRALEDLKEILDYLFEIKYDLPQRFRSELAHLLKEIDEQPEKWRPKVLPIRRAQLKLTSRLHYYVDYRFVESEREIHIFQIVNQKSDPKSWRLE